MAEKTEEQIIYEAFTSGNNILLHGPAGTGKTFSVNSLISSLKMRKDEDTSCSYVTAPTGMAANHINGTTIHFNFSIGALRDDMTKYAEVIPEYDYFEIKERKGLELKYHNLVNEVVKKSSFRDRNLEYLFIDEISMVGATILIILDALLRNTIPNGRRKPMGGIQCIFCGDFYQLPPVKDEYCFNTKVWDALNIVIVPMLKCKRFGDDATYFDMILRLRKGELTSEDKSVLMNRAQAFKDGEHLLKTIPPLELYPYNKNVELINRRMLDSIEGPEYVFECIDNISINERFVKGKYDLIKVNNEIDKVLDNSMPKTVSMRVGAQMILVRNYSVSDKLSNGRMFKVLSIDKVNQNNDDILEDLLAEPEYQDQIIVKNPLLYSIKILINDGTVHTINPISVKVEHKKFTCSRLQFPTMLAWAVTCHRSQGQTLESAIVDASSSFTFGQSYVALSRVTKIDNLFISGLNFTKIKVNPEVRARFD